MKEPAPAPTSKIPRKKRGKYKKRKKTRLNRSFVYHFGVDGRKRSTLTKLTYAVATNGGSPREHSHRVPQTGSPDREHSPVNALVNCVVNIQPINTRRGTPFWTGPTEATCQRDRAPQCQAQYQKDPFVSSQCHAHWVNRSEFDTGAPTGPSNRSYFDFAIPSINNFDSPSDEDVLSIPPSWHTKSTEEHDNQWHDDHITSSPDKLVEDESEESDPFYSMDTPEPTNIPIQCREEPCRGGLWPSSNENQVPSLTTPTTPREESATYQDLNEEFRTQDSPLRVYYNDQDKQISQWRETKKILSGMAKMRGKLVPVWCKKFPNP